jgi:transcriptional regulator with XRE-family HTH domain
MRKIMDKIRNRRKELHISQEDLAKDIGISQNYYSSLETGKTRLYVEQLEVIAEALGCNPEDFFKDEETEIVATKKNDEKTNIEDTGKSDVITFRYSEKDKTAVISMPKDVKPSLLKMAMEKAVASVKGTIATESSDEFVVKSDSDKGAD